MKKHKNLFDQICSFENLLLAARKAQKGKRSKHHTARFNTELEKELVQLQRELLDGSYQPGHYHSFYIYDPKKRLISAAPYRDRVVHHAVCNIIEPIFEKAFIYDSYANRKGKGTHRAIQRYQEFCRKNEYVLKCDIKKYFPSIDHEILKREIRGKISCNRSLQLIDKIIDCSNPQEEIIEYFLGDDLLTPLSRRRGLPIGNLTSQFFSNIYLNRFDHFIKEKMNCKYYIRYVDDFVIFCNDKNTLDEIKKNIVIYLSQLRLKMNEKKFRIYRVGEGVEFLGHRIFRHFRLLKKQNIIRFKRRLKKYRKAFLNDEMSLEKLTQSIQSWVAHASHSNTWRLREKIFSEYIITKG